MATSVCTYTHLMHTVFVRLSRRTTQVNTQRPDKSKPSYVHTNTNASTCFTHYSHQSAEFLLDQLLQLGKVLYALVYVKVEQQSLFVIEVDERRSFPLVDVQSLLDHFLFVVVTLHQIRLAQTFVTVVRFGEQWGHVVLAFANVGYVVIRPALRAHPSAGEFHDEESVRQGDVDAHCGGRELMKLLGLGHSAGKAVQQISPLRI
mmetsp:Transcript_46046/g.114487  ORF Transcript_46046/g.114487 Transcript_46046/m.114487 type:complete len:204 (-) Transcript_46046:1714-2325(-)